MDYEKLRCVILTSIAAATAASLFLFVVLLTSPHAYATDLYTGLKRCTCISRTGDSVLGNKAAA